MKKNALPAKFSVTPLALLLVGALHIQAAMAQSTVNAICSTDQPWCDLAAAEFQKATGIKVMQTKKPTGEALAQLRAEASNPKTDIWWGGTGDPFLQAADVGLLEPYRPDYLKDLHQWSIRQYGISQFMVGGFYTSAIGFGMNTELLKKKHLPEPKCWADVIKPEYKGLIWMSNPNTAGTAKLIINTMVQMKGHDAAMEYFKALDANVAQYTKSGSGPSKMVGPGECVIGIGFLHDGITQILAGYDNIQLVLPASGTSYEVGATAIFKGAKHMNAAKLWIEYALSPECVNLAKTAESYQFLVLDNAEQPAEATQFGLDANKTINYDFADAKANTSKYVEDFFTAIGSGADDRFKTE